MGMDIDYLQFVLFRFVLYILHTYMLTRISSPGKEERKIRY